MGKSTPEPLPLPRACVFDLDGTLVDSLQDVAEAVNHCLELLSLPTHRVAEYRYLVGEGIPMLCQRAIGKTHAHLVLRLAELARTFYRTRLLVHTRPYPGVPELILRLRRRGVKLAVLSNKPHDATVRIVEALWPPGTFDCIWGYVEEQYRKPSPHYLQRICAALRVLPAETWLVGDTPTDIETARAGGAVGVGITWGFRTSADLEAAGARYIVDRPDQLG